MLASIQVLQNKLICSCLFLPKSTNINYLFHKFNVLKINNIIKFAECFISIQTLLYLRSFVLRFFDFTFELTVKNFVKKKIVNELARSP